MTQEVEPALTLFIVVLSVHRPVQLLFEYQSKVFVGGYDQGTTKNVCN